MNRLLEQDPTGALNDRFEQIGLQSFYVFNNMGSFGIFFALYGVVLLVLHLLRDCGKKGAVRKWLKRKMVWGFLHSSIKESSAVIALSVWINLKTLQWQETGAFVQNLIAFAFSFLVGVIPMYSVYIIYSYFNNADEKYFS